MTAVSLPLDTSRSTPARASTAVSPSPYRRVSSWASTTGPGPAPSWVGDAPAPAVSVSIALPRLSGRPGPVCQLPPGATETSASVPSVSTVAYDVQAVRRRFSALDRRLAFFDAPGGSQVPDEVIDAMADYLRESNANVGGPYETSRRTEELVERVAGRPPARFLGCARRRGRLRPEHDDAQLRALADGRPRRSRPATRSSSRSSTTTATSRPGSSSRATWTSTVRFADIRDDTHPRPGRPRARSSRTGRASSPSRWASNAVGTLVRRRAAIAALAHEAGALAWVDAVHYAPHGPIDVAEARASTC